MRFRLRYLQHDFELTEGQFAVGRNASCQLALDDPLVSRRHALFEVRHGTVVVEDLGSRNGVIVNGERIDRPQTLAAGDRVLIGSQELTLIVEARGETRGDEAARGKQAHTLPKIAAALPVITLGDVDAENSSVKTNASKFGFRNEHSVEFDPRTLTQESDAPPSGPGGRTENSQMARLEVSMVRRSEQFRLLGSVADKALALGRALEAERLLASALGDVIEASRAGRLLPPELVDEAARYSSRLATATGKGGWADYVVELYEAQERPPPAPVIAELYNALRKVQSFDVARLKSFVEQIRNQASSYGPADRFLFQRLEGLLRVATVR